MKNWLKVRLEIIKLTLRNPTLIVFLAALLLVQLTLALVPPSKMNVHLNEILTFIPWYGWVIGWLVVFWFASIEYSLKRKEVFDQTSMSFFKAYLDSLIKQGNHLFNYSEEKDFYSKINDWQHQVIQGIAIGLGPQASEKYFHEMDKKNPTGGKTSQQVLSLRTSDALCKILQDNIEELNRIRLDLRGSKGGENEVIESGKDVKLIGESKP
jgi:hypothetical protein